MAKTIENKTKLDISDKIIKFKEEIFIIGTITGYAVGSVIEHLLNAPDELSLYTTIGGALGGALIPSALKVYKIIKE